MRLKVTLLLQSGILKLSLKHCLYPRLTISLQERAGKSTKETGIWKHELPQQTAGKEVVVWKMLGAQRKKQPTKQNKTKPKRTGKRGRRGKRGKRKRKRKKKEKEKERKRKRKKKEK